MKTSRLDQVGLKPSPIGFGCEPLGDADWGVVNLAEVRCAVRCALDFGITVFDTADAYGLGRSEEELSLALGSDRHKVLIITKFGIRWEPAEKNGRARTFRDASPEYLNLALERSLRRLRLEAIPLYLVHWPDSATPLEETLGALERAREAGKILSYGLSNFPSTVIESAATRFGVAAVEAPFSLVDADEYGPVSDVARKHHLATFTYGPLAQGLLTGKYDETSSFSTSDRRHRLPQFSQQQWQYNAPLLDTLRSVAQRHDKTMAQTAIRWVLDSGQVDSVIVGAKAPAQIEANMGALGWNLYPQEKSLLLSLARSRAMNCRQSQHAQAASVVDLN